MKIVVFGANGKTGRKIVELALEAGHQVVAFVRSNKVSFENHVNLSLQVANLSDIEKLKLAITGADVCVSALGGNSLSKSAVEVRVGIENIVKVMSGLNVSRFIYLSSLGAGDSRYLMPQPIRFFIVNVLLRVPLSDHTKNESFIAESNLKWTFVRPGGLTDDSKTSELVFGVDQIKISGNPSISRHNVAKFIINQLTNDAFVCKAVWLYETSHVQ